MIAIYNSFMFLSGRTDGPQPTVRCNLHDLVFLASFFGVRARRSSKILSKYTTSLFCYNQTRSCLDKDRVLFLATSYKL